MMKRVWGFLFLFVFALPMLAWATADSELVARDKVGFLGSGVEKSSYSVRITSSGHIVSSHDKRNELGSPTYRWGQVYGSSGSFADQVFVASGILLVHEYFSDLPAATTSNYKSSGFTITTATLRNAGTTFVTADFSAQGDYPRNVVVIATIATTAGGAISTVTIVGSAIITGVDVFGRVVSESVSFSTSSNGTGNIPFMRVSSVTVICSSITAVSGGVEYVNAIVHVGTGNKIGLSCDILSAADIYKILDSNVDILVSAVTLDLTYNTITFSNAPNASRDYNVYIRATTSVPK